MKRKLFLGLAAMAALTITSCQKDLVINQIPEEQPIGFGTYVGRDAQTKATSIDDLGDLVSKDFGVFAYHYAVETGEDWDDKSSSSKPNFMYNQQVDVGGTVGNYTFSYTPQKYWPSNDDHITFFAYSPYTSTLNTEKNINTFSAVTKTGAPTLDFFVTTDVDKQEDLLYASALDLYTSQNITTGVVLNFNHALSRIGFKVKTTDINSNKNKVKVNSITLSGNFTTNGTCNLSDGSFTSVTEGVATYTSSFTTNNVAIGSTPYDLMESAADQYIMIIPTDEFQSTTKIGISVNYDLYVYDDMLTDKYSTPINKTATGEIDGITFVKGNAYTLVLTISPDNAITFTATVSPWEPTDDTSGTPVTDPTEKDVPVQ